MLLITFFGPYLTNLKTFLGRVPAKNKKKCNQFCVFLIFSKILPPPTKFSGEYEDVFRMKKYSLYLDLYDANFPISDPKIASENGVENLIKFH